MNIISWLILIVNVGGMIDATRYSYAEWRVARRDKNFWIVALFFFGPLFLLPYIIVVRPRLRSVSKSELPAAPAGALNEPHQAEKGEK